MIYQTIFLQIDGSSLQGFMFPLLALAVLYFFMIRPQMNRQKKEKKFQSEIKKGAKIVTTSGIHGKISEINNDGTIVVETGAGKIKFERVAISMELTSKYTTTTNKK